MFESLRLSRKRKKITKLIEQMKYRDAYLYAMTDIFSVGTIGKPKLVHEDMLAMFDVLRGGGMPELQARRYDAEYYSVLANNDSNHTRLERYKRLLECRKELGEISEYEATKEKIKFSHSLDPTSDEIYNIKMLSNDLNHLDCIISDDDTDDEKDKIERQLREDILLNRFRAKQISFLDYEKSLYTLRGEKWFNYQIKIDEEGDRPDAFVLSFDYNDLFVEWLTSHGITLTPSESEGVESGTDEYKELLVEKWAKSSLISLAATMLAEDGGDTFRSVVASEPEGSIVEKLEIDRDGLEDYYGDNLTPEQITEIANKTRNRKMYR